MATATETVRLPARRDPASAKILRAVGRLPLQIFLAAIDTRSASLSLSVTVARSGTPPDENIVYFVEICSITQRNLLSPPPITVPHVTTQ